MIRPITIDDVQACLDIYNWYIENSSATFETEPLTLAEFTERIEGITQRYPWIVLEEDGRIKGYAYLSAFNPRIAYEWTADLAIYVDQNLRGQGVGSRLMETILQIAEERGFVNVVSVITSENTPSRQIHEKFGFENKVEFDHVGYKFAHWLGVCYYLIRLNIPENDPARPL